MKKNILVLYGGMSPEHEVSVVTALQVMNALSEAGMGVIPVYVSKKGEWVRGDKRFLKPAFYRDLSVVEASGKRFLLTADRGIGFLKRGLLGFGGIEEEIDAVFPVFHGKNGEDGSMQGLLELAGLPYVGCGIGASAFGMDKWVSKRIAERVGLKVVEDVLVTKEDWKKREGEIKKEIGKLGKKLFVKPVTLGSTIGVSRVTNEAELVNAMEVAFYYDERVIVEKEVDKKMEVNISVMGNDPYQTSVTERPVSSTEILSFEDKYIGGGKTKGMASLKREMPAPIGKKLTEQIEEEAVKLFRAMGGRGIARLDFMVNKKGELIFNEINTMPGSLAFYLWKEKGVSFTELVKKLVSLAEEEWSRKQAYVTSFESNILAGFAKRGVKGGAKN